MIVRSVEELHLEHKGLTNKVLAKQQQINLLESGMTINQTASEIPHRHSESTTKPVCIFV
jgi:hypothetical protein